MGSNFFKKKLNNILLTTYNQHLKACYDILLLYGYNNDFNFFLNEVKSLLEKNIISNNIL